jgi:hypothetical protein
MLYNEQWDKNVKEPEVKADPFKLKTLIAWLETQNPEQTYDYYAPHKCLLAQYFNSVDDDRWLVGGGFVHNISTETSHRMPRGFNGIAHGRASRDNTFGKALARAQAYQE